MVYLAECKIYRFDEPCELPIDYPWHKNQRLAHTASARGVLTFLNQLRQFLTILQLTFKDFRLHKKFHGTKEKVFLIFFFPLSFLAVTISTPTLMSETITHALSLLNSRRAVPKG